MSKRLPLFVKRDLDGFFGLFIDNLVQLLLILTLCASLCGIPADSDLMVKYILPGAAVSLLVGNLFYAWQAHRLAKREGRDDVTALPYGINTVSLLVYVIFVMKPVYDSTQDAQLAWGMGLIACLGSGVIEFLGAFVAGFIRQHTPRAALLSTLSGIAIGFISMTFALQIFQRPLVAMLPLGFILLTYFARVGFPLGLPGGFLAVLIGTACAWLLPMALPESLVGPAMSVEKIQQARSTVGLHLPVFVGETLWHYLRQPEAWLGHLAVIVPMGLFNVVGSLQNIESAEAAGDRFPTGSSLAVNGLGTVIAACFGSCFPTTIYIGHPGWKELGARAGYSTLNGMVVTAICLTGTVGIINASIPTEAGIAIVLWIGVIITAQAFQATPKEHAPAVAVGLFPAIAAWGMTVVQGAFFVNQFAGGSTATLQSVLAASQKTEVSGFLIHGMLTLERGYIFTCMFLAALSVALIERRFFTAAVWAGLSSLCTFIGLMHAYQLSGNEYDYLFLRVSADAGSLAFRAYDIGIGYGLLTLLFLITAFLQRNSPAETATGEKAKRKNQAQG